LNLELALDSLSPESEDGHIKDLATRVRQIEQDANTNAQQVVAQAVDHEFKKVRSTDEQEETEK